MRNSTAGDITLSFLGFLILSLLALIFLLFFIGSVGDVASNTLYQTECKQYIELHQLGNNDILSVDFSDFPCKKQEILVSEKESYDVYEKISDLQLQCLQMWGDSSEELFKDTKGEKVTFCSPCTSLTFEDQDLSLPLSGFFTFQHTAQNSGKTYFEHFFPNKGKAQLDEYTRQLKINSDLGTIEGDQEYLIVFSYTKGTKEITRIKDLPVYESLLKDSSESTLLDEISKCTNHLSKDFLGDLGYYLAYGVSCPLTTLLLYDYKISSSSGKKISVKQETLLLIGKIALAPINPALAVGSAVSYVSYYFFSSEPEFSHSRAIHFIPFETNTLKSLGCDVIIGDTERGVTKR